jgi:hypothetical protein
VQRATPELPSLELTVTSFELLDAALAAHMHKVFGVAWRSMCHQSAKVAQKALQRLYPAQSVQLLRVELVAMMDGAGSFVHIGWSEDEEKIPGKNPAHFAVRIGSALYDPTFAQLKGARTPLDLPPTPYFFHTSFFEQVENYATNFRMMAQKRPTGLLRVGYKMQPETLSAEILQTFMSDDVAERHAIELIANAGLQSEKQG